MCVSIKLKIDNIKNKLIKNHALTLISSYFPHSGYKDDELDLFAESFVQFYSSSAPIKNATIIVGADINASIGNRNTDKDHHSPSTAGMEKTSRFENDIDPIQDLMVPHGNPYRNSCGERILNIMRELDLHSPNTFFDSHGKFDTWRCPSNKQPYQINHFLIPRTQLCHTFNVQRKFDGAYSDHAALLIEFELDCNTLLSNKSNKEDKKHKTKIDNHILHTTGKSQFQDKVSSFFDALNPTEKQSTPKLFQ